jgi:hypothetical protein
MKHIVIIAAVLLGTAVQVQAAQAAVKHSKDHAMIYNRDSPDPGVGWHTDKNGMRVCTNDCDNPEIPGSGARCHDVTVMGMAMRECVTSNY